MTAQQDRPASGPDRAFGDTNLFVSLFAGPRHPLHEPALGLFRRVAEGSLALIVTSVVVAELVYVARSLLEWSRIQTADRLGALLEANGLVVPEQKVLQRALGLYRDRPRLDFADAFLAASALAVSPAGAVASFDSDFDIVPGLYRISS